MPVKGAYGSFGIAMPFIAYFIKLSFQNLPKLSASIFMDYFRVCLKCCDIIYKNIGVICAKNSQ